MRTKTDTSLLGALKTLITDGVFRQMQLWNGSATVVTAAGTHAGAAVNPDQRPAPDFYRGYRANEFGSLRPGRLARELAFDGEPWTALGLFWPAA